MSDRAEKVKRLADQLSMADGARDIPTGELWRGIAHSQYVAKRAELHAAIDALASPQPTAAAPDVLAMREALRELVALKDLRDSPEYILLSGTLADYERRKPLAWAAARAALSAQGEAKPEPRAPSYLGVPFKEARETILALPLDDARGLAISLLIQLGAWERNCSIATPEPQEGRKTTNPVPDWMVALPCAMVKDRNSARGAWLYIPHADGQWVSAAKLSEFSLAIIDAWRKEHGITQDGERT